MINYGSGPEVAFSTVPGERAIYSLTDATGFANWSGPDGMAEADPSITGATAGRPSSLVWLFGIALLLVALKFAVEHERSGMDFAFTGVGVYNFVANGIMALLFIVVTKIIVNKYPVPGLTDIVNVA